MAREATERDPGEGASNVLPHEVKIISCTLCWLTLIESVTRPPNDSWACGPLDALGGGDLSVSQDRMEREGTPTICAFSFCLLSFFPSKDCIARLKDTIRAPKSGYISVWRGKPYRSVFGFYELLKPNAHTLEYAEENGNCGTHFTDNITPNF